MMRALAATVSLVAAVAVVGGAAAATAPVSRDVVALATEMERMHPDLYASTPRARFKAEVRALARQAPSLTRAQLTVGLMRLVALAGPRNGHTAVYPFDAHPRPLHVYPLRLYPPDGPARRRRAAGRR